MPAEARDPQQDELLPTAAPTAETTSKTQSRPGESFLSRYLVSDLHRLLAQSRPAAGRQSLPPRPRLFRCILVLFRAGHNGTAVRGEVGDLAGKIVNRGPQGKGALGDDAVIGLRDGKVAGAEESRVNLVLLADWCCGHVCGKG